MEPLSSFVALRTRVTWSRAPLRCRDIWVPATGSGGILRLRHSFVCWVSHWRRGYSVHTARRQPGGNAAMAAVSVRRGAAWGWGSVAVCLPRWLLRQPGGKKRACSPWGFFSQPLSPGLAYPGFSKQRRQCEQQHIWDCEQNEGQYKRLWRE